MSCRPGPSAAQNTITLRDGSFSTRNNVCCLLASDILTVCLCWAITIDRQSVLGCRKCWITRTITSHRFIELLLNNIERAWIEIYSCIGIRHCSRHSTKRLWLTGVSQRVESWSIHITASHARAVKIRGIQYVVGVGACCWGGRGTGTVIGAVIRIRQFGM